MLCLNMREAIFIAIFNVLVYNAFGSHFEYDWEPMNPAFDPEIYKDALDPELCSAQLNYIRRNNTALRLTFLEAGMRLPRAILELNNLDLGNYDQCLGINYEHEDSAVIEGKYCLIRAPLEPENFASAADALHWEYDPYMFSNQMLNKFQDFQRIKSRHIATKRVQRVATEIPNSPVLRLALCIPKTCTSREGMNGLIYNLTSLGFRFEEEFCRFKNDKPWVPADYLAIVLFSLIGLLTIISTTYDVWHQIACKTELEKINTICRSFSIYTNGKTLTAFSENPKNLSCIDGLRSISMFWIIIGHCYVLLPPTYNNLYAFEWIVSFGSQWVLTAPFAVDTFLFIAGLLLVYTTVGKFDGMKLLKNLHIFYLNRLLRMFPILAALILLQVSVFHRAADGPLWTDVERLTNDCRTNWWLTLLYVQNYINTPGICISHTWYLAIDIHCYLVSPIILFWVLNGKRKQAWTALTFGLLASLTIAAIYCFINKFQGWLLVPPREDGEPNYSKYYYINTLTRAPAFFTGMLFGYLLANWHGRKPYLPKYVALFFWLCVAGVVFTLTYTIYLMKDFGNWNNGIVDDLFNVFARPAWAVCVGWVIFACQHGYAGPINWFLCLNIWKLPSRVSYAMYLFHYLFQHMVQGSARQPIYFTEAVAMYEFMSQVMITFGVSFVLTLVINAPFTVFIKLLMGANVKKPPKESTDNK